MAVSADRLAFESLFLETIGGGPVTLAYVEATPEEIEYFAEVARINAAANGLFDEIIERTASEMGLTVIASDEDFMAVLAIALPEAFDVILAGQSASLAALEPPPGLVAEHDDLVAAWDGLLAERDNLIAAFVETPTFDVLAPVLGILNEACLALQSDVGLRLLDIDLVCIF